MRKKNKCLKQPVIRWKQFTRHGDAIFRSLGREIIISSLSVATLTFAVPTTAHAQTVANHFTDFIDDDTIQTVEVTASKLPLPMEQTARIVSVITREEIEKCAANSVNDVLKYAAAVDVRQRGAFGIQTDININGGTHDQIVVLIDGVNVSSPHTGHLAYDLPLSIDDIERIEILEGAASKVYGTSAFSGAINIITKKNTRGITDNKWDASVRAEAGSYGSLAVGANTRFSNKNSFNSLSLNYYRSDGGTHNSEFNKYNAFYNGGICKELFDINWFIAANIQDFGANTFYSGKFPNQFEYNQKYHTAVTLQTKGKIQIKPTLYWSKAFDNFQLIKHSDFGENYHMTDVYGVSVNMSTQSMLGTSLFAADFRNEGILSTSLGKPLETAQFVDIPGAHGKYTKKDNRTNISYFIEHDILLKKWSVSLGVMANMNTALDHRFRLYPGIDICFKPSNEWKLYASWNMAQRMPTFTDLYYKSPTQEGNIGLKPEKTSEFSLAAHYRGLGLRSNLRLFYRHDMSMIDWILTPEDEDNGYTTYHATNFKLNKYGANINLDILFNELFNENSWLKSANINYSYINQKRFDDVTVYASSYALDYLRHKLVVALEAKVLDCLYADISFRCQNRKGSFLKYNPETTTDNTIEYKTYLQKYGTYGILSCKLKWIKENMEIYIQGENITNHKYYDIGNVIQPGIWIMAGTKFKFL